MSTDSKVQLLAEGSGPKVRTEALTEPTSADSGGNAQADNVRHQQVVTVADRRGELETGDFEAEALGLLRAIAESLAAIQLSLS